LPLQTLLYLQTKTGRFQAHSKLNETLAWCCQNLKNENTSSLKPRQHQQKSWHIVNEAKICFRTQAKRRILKVRKQDSGQTQKPSQSGRKAGRKKPVAWGNDDRDHGTEKTDGKQCQQHGTILK
jgi:hypothetical protein